MLLSELGAALRKARKERRLTLKQVAEKAGVHFTTLSSLERGKVSELGVRKLLRVAETLGLELVLRPTGQRYTLDDVAKDRREPAEDETAGSRVTVAAPKSAAGPSNFPTVNQLPDLARFNELTRAASKTTDLLSQANPLNKLTELASQANPLNKLTELASQANPLNKLTELASQASQLNKLNELAKTEGLLARALRGPVSGANESRALNESKSQNKSK